MIRPHFCDLDDGSVACEFIRPNWRLGFALEVDKTANCWLVSKKPRITWCTGLPLKPTEWFLTFIRRWDK